MSIEIKITDPYRTDADELRAVAEFLTGIADKRRAHVADGRPARVKPVAAVIDPADHPDAGVDAAEIFGGNANPAEVFGKAAVPSTAGAVPQPTAPAAMPDSSATVPTVPQIPVPSPAASAATAAAPEPAANPAPGVDVDADGLPWDARIHASTRVKNADGRWRGKRGVDDATVATVTAELRAVMGNASAASGPVAAIPTTIAASPALVVPPPPPVVADVPPPPAALGNVPPPPPVDGAQASTVAPPPVAATASPSIVPAAPAPTAPADMSFPILCAKITQALNGGTLTQQTLQSTLAAYQLTGLPTLAAFPNLVGPVAQSLGFA